MGATSFIKSSTVEMSRGYNRKMNGRKLRRRYKEERLGLVSYNRKMNGRRANISMFPGYMNSVTIER